MAAEEELNNWKWQLHQQRGNNPNSVTVDELTKNDEEYDKKIGNADEKSDNERTAIFTEADKLRREMLRRLPPSKWTQEDRDKDNSQLFMGIPETSAADYLDRLAKRI